jgi:vacuolar-type H+-ATPase subunit I/STV1
MTTKLKFIFIGSLCVLLGSLLSYFQGYKDNGVIIGFSYFICFTGWSIILLSLAGKFFLKEKKIPFKKNKLKWLNRNISYLVLTLAFGGLIIANLMIVSKLSDDRVSKILSTGLTKQTIATITKIEDRNSRGGPKSYAIIEYPTESKIVSQAIFNYENHYSVGQKYELKYAVAYPEMFQLLNQVNK